MNQIQSIRVAMFSMALLYATHSMADCKGSRNLPPEQHQVAFESDKADISQPEHTRLKSWIALVNSKYPIQNWTTIIGSAAESEREPKKLAMRRAVTVAREALEDGLVNAPLQIRVQIYPVAKPGPVDSESREVTVQLSPGCPNNCCDGQ
ncbi:hypothetical protein [Paraburkholderia sp. Ac-20347]|uniref:hypothetical protein n=1 Tax=Paraburkholderia sp. Ac-20347 TaxID=2703892 RepID=UPI00197D94F8|nr:hypothetical protein [Paraburkholderia sp. Ac-20347]MBN3814572.1 hypothetical protein [Paraburkholderia sp. Ac-20347]